MRKSMDVPPGTRFGRLSVLKEMPVFVDSAGRRRRKFQCRCDCCNVTIVHLVSLRSGASKSCGCLQKERHADALTKHGMWQSPEYNIWIGMKSRCANPTDPVFHRYGGRGINVCDRWRESFAAFFADMGPRPSPDHSIDRIDNAKGYSPGNCRWATRKEQNRNRRDNRLLTFGGQTLCLAEWAEKTGIHYNTLHGRLSRGYTVEQALTKVM